MNETIKKITITPLLFTLAGSLIILVVFMFLFFKMYEKKLLLIQQEIVKNEKMNLKNDVITIKEAIDKYRLMGYVLASCELENVLKLAVKNDKFIVKPENKEEIKKGLQSHFSKNFFFWVKSPILTYPNIKLTKEVIGNRKFEFAILNKKRYLVEYTKTDKNTFFGIAFNEEIIKKAIKRTFFEFLDEYNKNKTSYIAIGKIYSLKSPDKDGVFGELIYMPPKLKNLKGKKLSVKEPDKAGNYFREKYYKCFQEGKDCFVKYVFKNPITGKYEEKISYFGLYKPFKWSVVKGEYLSTMKQMFLSQRKALMKEMLNLFIQIFVVVIIIYIIIGFIIYLINKKHIKKVLNEYTFVLYNDKLTKLPNRNKLLDDIKNFNSLIMLDIKDFTDINDVYGFDIGDSILKIIAIKLLNKYKENVYRMGSDEFVIGFKRKINENDLKELINLQIKYEDISVDLIAGGSNNKVRLLESAELALKEAYKEQVKYKLYDENILKQQQQRISKLKLLKTVLEKENIIPYYQCIVDKEGKTVKYEALMRIKLDDNTIQSPFFFMDLIKEAKLYIPFSKLMIKKVFEDLEKIDKKVSINISFEDIINKDMKNYILSFLNENNAKKVVFEILESESVKNYEILKSFIDEVKAKGVEFAIDDFGSGYSNFVNIMKLNPNIIKIDGSLIKEIDNEKNYKLVELMVTFAKEFGLKTVAEFVSDNEKFEMLKKLNVDEYQGYYFCEPEPLENILKKDKISSKKGNNEY